MSKMKPNSFQIPNAIVDDFIKCINGNELKIYLIIVRKTKGWNKEYDGISISQFIEFSGISSHNTIRKSLKNLVDLNLVEEKKRDGKYSIFSVSDPYQFLTMSKNEPLPKNDIVPLPTFDRPPLPKIDNTNIHYPKEEEKEEYLKNILSDDVSYEVFSIEFYDFIYPKNKKSNQQKIWYGNKIKENILEEEKQTIENISKFVEFQDQLNFKLQNQKGETNG